MTLPYLTRPHLIHPTQPSRGKGKIQLVFIDDGRCGGAVIHVFTLTGRKNAERGEYEY